MFHYLVNFIIVFVVIFFKNCLADYASEWKAYKHEMGKSYSSDQEDKMREIIWKENYEYIQMHNKQKNKEFYLDINPFCDMTRDEVFKQKFGLKLSLEQKLSLSSNTAANHSKNLKLRRNLQLFPDSINWVDKGFVSDIKDQGTCGACWSFVTTGALESYQLIKSGVKKTYSEQNLIDCSGSYGNEGCDGGLMSLAFQYIIDNKGLEPDSKYKYSGKMSKCNYNKADNDLKDIRVLSYQKIPIDEEALKKIVATKGPVAVGIDANLKSFLLYKGGIYEDNQCSSTDLNHAVLVVGYGANKKGKEYWIIKNQWGVNWGEKGFMRLARNKNNQCGIASLAGYPIIA